MSLMAAFALTALTACDTVEENERWGEEVPVEFRKKVLVEDFTGQNCPNCPLATNLLKNLMTSPTIAEHVIPVSIHGGSMAFDGEKIPFGLATKAGAEYNAKWNVAAWPSGLVDRKGGLQEYTAWTNSIVDRLALTPQVNIDIRSSYNAETRRLDLNVNAIEAVAGALEDAHLTVWIVESGIVSRQQLPNGGGLDANYEHNHVLRDCLTELMGDAVDALPVAVAEDGVRSVAWSKTYEVPLGYGLAAKYPAYYCKPENMGVVAFVTDKDGVVMQVEETPLSGTEE